MTPLGFPLRWSKKIVIQRNHHRRKQNYDSPDGLVVFGLDLPRSFSTRLRRPGEYISAALLPVRKVWVRGRGRTCRSSHIHFSFHLQKVSLTFFPLSFLQQLIQKLNCFVIRPAAVPVRLHDTEEEEIPEEIETDELMRSLAPKQMVAPRFRWRRSRWLRYCPVSLYDGNKVLGKPEFAVR